MKTITGLVYRSVMVMLGMKILYEVKEERAGRGGGGCEVSSSARL